VRVPGPETLARFAPHLRGTDRSMLGHDLLAGLTIAAVSIPQAIAYALVAGLTPEMGLVAAAWPCAIAALLGSSPHLVTGPTNPTALVLGLSVVAPAVARTGEVPIDSVLATGLLAGAMLVGFGLVGVGRTSRFLSDSVIIGFATGAGVLIALRLVPELAPGLAPSAPPGGLLPRSWPVFIDAARALVAAGPRAIVIAVGAPAVALAIGRVDRRLPAALIALAAATGIVEWLGWSQGPHALARVGAVALDAAAPGIPWSADYGALAGPAFTIALLVTMQSIAAARSVPPAGPPFRLDVDRELLGQGAGNFSSALLGGMVTSGSLTRSAIARSAGGRSRLAAVTAGAVVALGLPVLGRLVEAIPMAALVGLVFLSGIQLVRPSALRRASTTRGDALVLVTTLLATLWIDLVQALYIGVFLSLALLVRRSGQLQMVELVRGPGGSMREIPIDHATGTTPVVLLQCEGDLNFAVAQALSDRLTEIGRRGPRVIVLRVKRVAHLDATVLEVLRETVTRLARRDTRFVLCGLTDDHVALLEGTELAASLGEEGLVRTGARLFEGFEEALRRARRMAGDGADRELFRSEPAAG
jgi:SulP family sulfate permease